MDEHLRNLISNAQSAIEIARKSGAFDVADAVRRSGALDVADAVRKSGALDTADIVRSGLPSWHRQMIDEVERLNKIISPHQRHLLENRLLNGYQVHSFGSGGSGSRHTIVREEPKKQQLKQPRNRLTILIIKICNDRGTTTAHDVWRGLKNAYDGGDSIILSWSGSAIKWETKPLNRCTKGKATTFKRSALPPKLSNIKKEYGHLLR